MSNDASEPSHHGANEPDQVVPDTKDWTWVLTTTCPECGLTAGDIDTKTVTDLIPDQVARWQEVLFRPDVGSRTRLGAWSPLEYACHVRDVYGVFAERTRLVLQEDKPTFPDWDQDRAAVVGRYPAQEPGAVARDLAAAAGSYASILTQVPNGGWERVGLRSNGSRFTLATLTQYLMHDVLHHLWDVEG